MASKVSRTNSYGFFYLEILKERVYHQEVNSEAELRQRILQAAIEMQRATTAGVTGRQVRERARACLRQNGGHFEQLLQ